MNYLKCKFLVLIFLSNCCFGQDSDTRKNKVSLGKSIELTRFDVFHAFSGTMRFNEVIKVMPSLGVGIQKTYTLQRLYPRFSMGVGLDLFKKAPKFSLGPEIRAAISAYSLNEQVRFSYTDAFFGYFIAYGEKWQLVHQLSFGRGMELQLNTDEAVSYWGFHLAIGVAYVL